VRTVLSILALMAVLSGTWLFGCASTQRDSRNVRFRMADLDQAVAVVKTDLINSRFVGEQQASPTGVRLRARPLTNLSLDRFTEGEEQMVVSRVLSDPRVMVALEKAQIAVLDPEVTRPSDATHELFAEIRSLARQAATTGRAHDARRDAYLLEYRIIERGTTAIVWQATTEVARAATGLVID